MAERRMFAKTIVESDAFLDMPLSAQALYFHLGMAADDWGFVNNPKSVRRMCGASEDDLRLLVAKHFLVSFDSGCAAVKAWWINNYVQADRRHPTRYQGELETLFMDENKSYTRHDTGVRPADMFKTVSKMDTKCIQSVSNLDTNCIQPVSKMDTEVRLGKVRLGESNGYPSGVDTQPNPREKEQATPAPRVRKSRKKQDEPKHRRGANDNVLLTDSELGKLRQRFPGDYAKRIDDLSWYLATHNVSYKSHYLVILNWARKDEEEGATPKVDSQTLDAINFAVDGS